MKTTWHKLLPIMTLLIGLSNPAATFADGTMATIDQFTGKPCYKCHRNKLTAPFVHSALTDKSCAPCHKTTNGNHLADPWLVSVKDRSARLCYECHEKWSNRKSVHPPILADDCLGCHAPHASGHEYLLRFSLKGICFECHGRSLVNEHETREATGFRNERQNLHYLHAGRNEIPCLACHTPHASDQLHLIRLKGSNGKEPVTITHTATPNGGSCTTSCHDTAGYIRN